MSDENRNVQDVFRTARLFTDGETMSEVQARLARARELSDATPRGSDYRKTRKTRKWWVRAFEQIIVEQTKNSP